MKKQFNIRLDEFDIEKINEYCELFNVSQSELIHVAFWHMMDALYEGDSYDNSIRALKMSIVNALDIKNLDI